MADSAYAARMATAAVPARTADQRHSALVRATHWITALCFFALLWTGIEIVISHPRFYWGETGNVNMPPLINLHIPSSRPTVPTGYGYVLPDQNGWSRALHFQTAWIAVITGIFYVLAGLATRHFRKHLLPQRTEASFAALWRQIAKNLRLERPAAGDVWSYNALQRLTYLFVIFAVFPLMIWTGLAMSPAIASVVPAAVTMLGGHQSARTIHFFGTIFLVLFLLVHVAMIFRAGFVERTRAMVTGHAADRKERV